MKLVELAKKLSLANVRNTLSFFEQISNGEYIPDPKKRIQVRDR